MLVDGWLAEKRVLHLILLILTTNNNNQQQQTIRSNGHAGAPHEEQPGASGASRDSADEPDRDHLRRGHRDRDDAAGHCEYSSLVEQQQQQQRGRRILTATHTGNECRRE